MTFQEYFWETSFGEMFFRKLFLEWRSETIFGMTFQEYFWNGVPEVNRIERRPIEVIRPF